MSKRIRLEVCPNKAIQELLWKLTYNGDDVHHHATQAEAIKAARILIALLLADGFTCTLKIKRPDGTIREERTYPRSSDPRRTKG